MKSPYTGMLFALVLGLVSCTQTTRLTNVADLPLKTVLLPSLDWQMSPLRSNAQYVLYGANSMKERQERLGDYYFVNWYDAQPELPVRVEMLYTQALTASQVLARDVELKEPRRSAGSRKTHFFFNGAERVKRGDVLSWRVNLYVDGKLVDSRRSYLWQD